VEAEVADEVEVVVEAFPCPLVALLSLAVSMVYE
jgi:hypothetical protein